MRPLVSNHSLSGFVRSLKSIAFSQSRGGTQGGVSAEGKDVDVGAEAGTGEARQYCSWDEEKWKPLPRPPPKVFLSGEGGRGSGSGSSGSGSDGEVRIVSALGPSFERLTEGMV